MKTIALATAALLTVPALAVASASPASARHGGDDDRDRTVRTGSCSGATDWKIKAEPDDGRLEVEAEIDGHRRGQHWRWTLRHNGRVVDSGRSTTRGRSGSFEVERHVGNARGADRFVFRAVRANGEVCLARVTR